MGFDEMRADMVKYQLAARDITDTSVLGAFLKVPRHEFVPENMREGSYEDYPLPIGKEQTISQPYTVAFMTQLLKLKGNEKVLEVGAGSGYQAAILCELASKVISLERLQPLADNAKENLKRTGYKVSVIVGDGTMGHPDEAPYDAIIVTAAAPRIPDPLKQQLADGGRLVIPVGRRREGQTMVRITRRGKNFKEETFGSFIFVPLIGMYGAQG